MTVRIAIDAMGGDHGPDMVVEGVSLALARYSDVKYILFGKEDLLKPLVKKYGLGSDVVDIRHCSEVITNDTKPSAALRNARDSSMRLAIDSVKSNDADAVVSAGNTGAYMALSKVILRTIKGIDRPAIAAPMPTISGMSIMLDLGANVGSDDNHLVQFALMGEVFARDLLNIKKPTTGLLNIGVEELKGSDVLKAAHQRLREGGYVSNFKGFVEGDDILTGAVDVVVTDGFSGNIALKTAEGACRFFHSELKRLFSHSILSKIAALLAIGGIKSFKEKVDPRRYNGATFLGLNGVAVKSHGGTDALGFSYAVGVAIDMSKRQVNDHIREELSKHLAADLEMVADKDMKVA